MHQIYLVYFLVCVITFAGCHPRPLRRKRQELDSDYALMRKYWDIQTSLGFFVNQGAADPGGDSAASTRSKIEHLEAEGSGEVKRDDIEPKPTSSITISKGEGRLANDEKISTEESGKLQAKLEKIPSSSSDGDVTTDPGDKKKDRTTVTCQGQKEWLQCDGPYELIKIKNAFWGRDNDYTCTKSGVAHGLKTDKNCAQDESNTINKVKEACDNENVCEVVASGIYFDKADCGDIYKYLRMEWECAPSESRIKETIS